MSNSNDLRVVSRVGAGELTMEEMEKTPAAAATRMPSQVLTGTPSAPDENFDS